MAIDEALESGVAHSHLIAIKKRILAGCRRIALSQNGVHNLFGQIRFLREGLLRCFLSLANQFAVELQPGAFLFHDAVFDADLEDAASLLMPWLKMMSNSASANGGATLFFTTFTLT